MLREVPINQSQTVKPFPWLQAREIKNNDLSAIELLNSEVSGKFVYSGGFLIYFQESGNWIFVAETKHPFHPTGWIVRDEIYWSKAVREKDSIIKNEEMRELVN